MPDQIYANACLMLPDRMMHGRVIVADGRIVEIAEGGAVPPGALDLGGDILAPGLIELHTDNLERHIEPRPSVDWPHASAIIAHDAELASTGITTVFDAVRVGSITRGNRYKRYARPLASEILDLREQGALRISHFLHLRAEVCSESLAEELAEFHPQDRVGIVSLMDHTPGQRQFRDMEKFRAYVMGKRALSEDGFREHVAVLMDLRARHGADHEAAAVAEAARLGAVLASHDDTTEAHVATSAAYGIGLAEFPTTLEAARACRAEGIRVMMGAPNLIRGGSHSGNVAAEELARHDLLDIVSSDYVPSALLIAALRLGRIWDDPARGFATVTAAPAEAAGLADRGRLAPGLRADMIRVGMAGDAPVVRASWVAGERVA